MCRSCVKKTMHSKCKVFTLRFFLILSTDIPDIDVTHECTTFHQQQASKHRLNQQVKRGVNASLLTAHDINSKRHTLRKQAKSTTAISIILTLYSYPTGGRNAGQARKVSDTANSLLIGTDNNPIGSNGTNGACLPFNRPGRCGAQ